MRQFLAFVHKEFLHILRDRRTLLILFGMPIAQILIFGFAISTEVRNIRFAVLDDSKDPSTREIIAMITSNPYFSFNRSVNSVREINEMFNKGDLDLAIVFEPDFQRDLLSSHASVQLLADGTDPNSAQASVAYTSAIIQNYLQTLPAPNTITSSAPVPVIINSNLKLLYNPQMVAAYNFVPGVMGLILMLVCAMMTAIAIVREKERGSMEVLLASPLRPIFIILAKVTPYMVLSLINVVSILLLATTVFGLPIAGSLWTLGLFCIVFIFTTLALGILISSMVASQIAAMVISGMALMMPTTILSGLMFPIDSMPVPLQYFSNVIPARWFISGVRKIMIQGVPLRYVLPELLVLLGMATLLTVVSLKKFKNRLQ